MEVSLSLREIPQVPFHVEKFDDKILEMFFKYLASNVKDFFSLSLANRRFQKLAVDYRDNIGEGLEELVPSYLRGVKDPAISGLSTLEKIRLARVAEENLVNASSLRNSFNTPEFTNTGYTHKMIIGNHFVYETKEFLSIGFMENLTELKFRGTGIEGLLAVHANKTLLVGFRRDKILLWDFNLLVGSGSQKVTQPENVFQKSPCFSNVGFLPYKGNIQFGPVADTINHLFAVATNEHVLVIDCNSWAQIEIPFKSGKQIEFTGTHLMLVSDKNIQIYEISLLLECFQKQETTDIYASFDHYVEQEIDCAKIDLKRLVVAFKKIEANQGM